MVQAIRERYDGERRNPWNEFECGSNYARSMASYSLLLALGGFQYDMTAGRIGFNPKINQNSFRSFWSLHQGWREFGHQDGVLELTVKYGNLELNSVQSDLLKAKEIEAVYLGDQEVAVTRNEDSVSFGRKVRVDVDHPLRIVLY